MNTSQLFSYTITVVRDECIVGYLRQLSKLFPSFDLLIIIPWHLNGPRYSMILCSAESLNQLRVSMRGQVCAKQASTRRVWGDDSNVVLGDYKPFLQFIYFILLQFLASSVSTLKLLNYSLFPWYLDRIPL